VGCSQSLISLVERGHFDAISVRTLRAILKALDALVVVEVRWRGGQVDRLVDEDHAALGGTVAAALAKTGWDVRAETTYSQYGERGAIDLLAWHPPTASLLVVEIKTELASAEETLRRLDQKRRLAPAIARERFGWSAAGASQVLVLPDVSTARRRLIRHSAIFVLALPARTAAVHRWLAQPLGTLGGVWFMSASDRGGRISRPSGRERVRRTNGASRSTPSIRGPILRPLPSAISLTDKRRDPERTSRHTSVPDAV
jgi:Holliday junction resolvase-like predicted endonuclease